MSPTSPIHELTALALLREVAELPYARGQLGPTVPLHLVRRIRLWLEADAPPVQRRNAEAPPPDSPRRRRTDFGDL